MRNSVAEGVIVKIAACGESDLIVWIFSPLFGPGRFLARRALKSVKRFGGRILLFNILKFEYSRRRPDELAMIESAALLETFPAIFSDEINLGRASLFSEVLIAAWGEGDPARNAYRFLLDFLRRAEIGKLSADRFVLDAFKFLEILGHRPELSRCADCGGVLLESSMYSVNEGGTVCVACSDREAEILAGRGTMPLKVGRAVIKSVDKAYNTESKFLDRMKFNNKTREEAFKLWIKHIQAIIGRTPKSYHYLEKFNTAGKSLR